MGKQRLCLLRRGVACIADLSATRTNVEPRSLKELFHTPAVRHWVRQRMIGNCGGHRGCCPQSNVLRKVVARYLSVWLQVPRRKRLVP